MSYWKILEKCALQKDWSAPHKVAKQPLLNFVLHGEQEAIQISGSASSMLAQMSNRAVTALLAASTSTIISMGPVNVIITHIYA